MAAVPLPLPRKRGRAKNLPTEPILHLLSRPDSPLLFFSLQLVPDPLILISALSSCRTPPPVLPPRRAAVYPLSRRDHPTAHRSRAG